MSTFKLTDSEVELVERTRRGIARLDRLRWVLRVFYVLLTCAVVGLAVAACDLIRGGWLQGMGPGFAAGLSVGVSLGLLIVPIAHALMSSFWGAGRTERLLVRCYDAVRELEVERGSRRAPGT